MKKFLSVFLTLVMLFSLQSTAFVADASVQSNSVSFLKTEDGRYVRFLPTRTSLDNNSDMVQATPTENDGIFLVEDSLYLVETTQTSYTLSEKVDLNSRDNNANKTTFNTYHISERLQKDIEENIIRERNNKNPEFSVSLYVPARTSTRSTSESTYTTNKGHKCKDYIVTYNNCRTDPVEKNGTTAKNHADALINFVISSVGCVSKTVSIFGAGKSALDLFISLHGNVSYGTQDDLTYSLLVYDKKTKDTYYFNPYVDEWEEGCFSQYVAMKRNDTYQYYGATGYSELIKTTLTQRYWTEHYYDPDFAVSSAPICFVDPYIFVKLYGTSFRM